MYVIRIPVDRLRSGPHQRLDRLVVVDGLLAADHVPQELDRVQLSIGILRPRVGDEADLAAHVEGRFHVLGG